MSGFGPSPEQVAYKQLYCMICFGNPSNGIVKVLPTIKLQPTCPLRFPTIVVDN